MTKGLRAFAYVLLITITGGAVSVAGPKPLGLRHVAIDLPGAPAEILHADLDADGREELAIVIARTQWGEIGTDRIEGMMQISEVVPALFDRREVRAYRIGADGAYTQVGDALPLPQSVISLEPGPPGIPIAVLTDDGLSVLELMDDAPAVAATGPPSEDKEPVELPAVPGMSAGAAAAPTAAAPAKASGAEPGGAPARTGSAASASTAGAGPALVLTPWISDRPVLAGSKTMIPRLGMVRDLDGDGSADLLLPANDGLAVYLDEKGALSTRAANRFTLSGDSHHTGIRPVRVYPRPEVGDLDGDHRPDLLVKLTGSDGGLEVRRGEGGGRFGSATRIDFKPFFEAAGSAAQGAATPKKKDVEDSADRDGELAYFGDLDGDGLAEAVFMSQIDTGKGELKQAKEPAFLYRFHRVGKDLAVQVQPYHELRVTGLGFTLNTGDTQTAAFQDLDGDGRKDLITVTLDFSLFQILRAVTTKRIGLGLDFHVWHQETDGRFTPVTGLDLSETLRVDLNDLKLTRLAQFAGDFDGDGRADFVHLGRGKDVTIHRGQAGCRYASKADLTVPLEEEPADVGLVRIGDFDGDGRDDLGVIRPLDESDPDVSSPVRLDLYLSGGAR